MVVVTDQAGESQRMGGGSPRSDVERLRALGGPVVVVVGAAVWLAWVLVDVTGQRVTGAAWVRVPLFVCSVAVCATFLVLAMRSPRPPGAPGPVEVRGGYGIDGPEQRRVRRALREGTPLRRGDRDRAVAQATRSLFRTTPGAGSVRDRYFNVAVMAYLLATALLNSSSLTAPRFGFSDLWTLVAFGVGGVFVAAGGWLPGRLGIPGRQWRDDRVRRRIEVLENHPVAQ